MGDLRITVEEDKGGGLTERRECKLVGAFNADEDALLSLDLESPDGLTTKTWAMDNNGNLLFGGVIVSTGGYVLDFGADVNAGDAGKYLLVDGRPGGTIISALSPSSERIVPKTSTLKRFAWNSQTADATTVFKVLINGVVKETITCDGDSGTAALTEAVALGDKVAVEFDAGTVSGNTSVVLYFE